jgi:hypothetical protein
MSQTIATMTAPESAPMKLMTSIAAYTQRRRERQ